MGGSRDDRRRRPLRGRGAPRPGAGSSGSRARLRLQGEGGQKAGVHVGAMTQHLPPEPGARRRGPADRARSSLPNTRVIFRFRAEPRAALRPGRACGQAGPAGQAAPANGGRLCSSFLSVLPGSREEARAEGGPRPGVGTAPSAPGRSAGRGGQFRGPRASRASRAAAAGVRLLRARRPDGRHFARRLRLGRWRWRRRRLWPRRARRGEQAWLGDPPPAAHAAQGRGRGALATRRGPAVPPPRLGPIAHEEASLAGGRWRPSSSRAGASGRRPQGQPPPPLGFDPRPLPPCSFSRATRKGGSSFVPTLRVAAWAARSAPL